MARPSSRMDTDRLARQLREQQEKLSGALGGEGATQQVMTGFAEAYRAWIEAISAKPQTMMDLQGRYMQEQMKLWMGAMHGSPDGEPPPDPSPESVSENFCWDSRSFAATSSVLVRGFLAMNPV